jgi:hypothetical protein
MVLVFISLMYYSRRIEENIMEEKFLRSAKSAETDGSMAEYFRDVKYGAQSYFDSDQERLFETVVQSALDSQCTSIYSLVRNMDVGDPSIAGGWVLTRMENPRVNKFAFTVRSHNVVDEASSARDEGYLFVVETRKELKPEAFKVRFAGLDDAKTRKERQTMLLTSVIKRLRGEVKDGPDSDYVDPDENSWIKKISIYGLSSSPLSEEFYCFGGDLSEILQELGSDASPFNGLIASIEINEVEDPDFVAHGRIGRISTEGLIEGLKVIEDILKAKGYEKAVAVRAETVASAKYQDFGFGKTYLLCEAGQRAVYLDQGFIGDRSRPLLDGHRKAQLRVAIADGFESLPNLVEQLIEQGFVDGEVFEAIDHDDGHISLLSGHENCGIISFKNASDQYVLRYEIFGDVVNELSLYLVNADTDLSAIDKIHPTFTLRMNEAEDYEFVDLKLGTERSMINRLTRELNDVEMELINRGYDLQRGRM